MSEKPCGACFFAFFENFFVPILTSGGPASFIMPLQIGKTPIVDGNNPYASAVQKRFDEANRSFERKEKMNLRKLELKDAPLMLEWMHDPDVVQNMQADFAHKTLSDCENFIRVKFSRAFAPRKHGEKSIPRFRSATKRIRRIIWFWMRKSAIFWTGLPNIELEKELPLSVPWYLPGTGKRKIPAL